MSKTIHRIVWAWSAVSLTIGCEAGTRPVQGTLDPEGGPPPQESPAAAQSAATDSVDAASSASLRFDFEEDLVGEAPRGFVSARSGQGAPARWEVIEAEDAPSGARVVAQLSEDATSYRFPLLVLDEFAAADVDLSVAGKAVAGSIDQAIGLVWRYRDEDNYYVVRANALEGNVVLYKMEDSRRSDLDIVGVAGTYGVDAEVPGRSWVRLRVVANGDLFVVELEGKELFRVRDRTFTQTGKVGLWTKADSVTWFDDLEVKALDSGPAR
ncbi:MAG TPA: hypothetical protein VNB06_00590 [Thermoanaerobaculia bacterium]|nr:hypothetical protein [Thermoanaerobaculia bacterium]